MTFSDLKKAVGANIRHYIRATNTWLTGRAVNEDDIGEIINHIYRDELFPLFAAQYPHDFRQVARANSWIATGTVDAASTGTTLVSTTGIFSNEMEGLYVYNETDDETAIIESYTSSTTVTLNSTIGDTWDGDTIYILGKEFTFGGEATDIYTVETIGVKYSDSDSYYKNCQILQYKPDIYQVGSETYSSGSPVAYLTTLQVSGVMRSAVGILPKMNTKLSNAIELNYIAKPVKLSADGDMPRLPVDTILIQGATAWALKQKEEFSQANIWQNDYEKSKLTALARYLPTAMGYSQRARLPRIYSRMVSRDV